LPFDEEKMGLTKRELAIVDETLQGRYTVSIRKTTDHLWKLVVGLDETGRTYELDTTRGGTRSWRVMEDAVRFALVNCTQARALYVEVDEWRFERVGVGKEAGSE
jgi:hypothetical protein